MWMGEVTAAKQGTRKMFFAIIVLTAAAGCNVSAPCSARPSSGHAVNTVLPPGRSPTRPETHASSKTSVRVSAPITAAPATNASKVHATAGTKDERMPKGEASTSKKSPAPSSATTSTAGGTSAPAEPSVAARTIRSLQSWLDPVIILCWLLMVAYLSRHVWACLTDICLEDRDGEQVL